MSALTYPASSRRVTEVPGKINESEAVATVDGDRKVGGPYYTLEDDSGSIVLVPVAEVPEEERIFWEDAEVRESILAGIGSFESGQIVERPDFFLEDGQE